MPQAPNGALGIHAPTTRLCCTACAADLDDASSTFAIVHEHPVLGVAMCHGCYERLVDTEFTCGDDGSD